MNPFRTLLEGVASVGFLLLFPGFALYHTFYAFGFIPPVLAGFFTPIALVLAAGFITLVPWWLPRLFSRTKGYGPLALAFFVLCAVWIGVNFLVQSEVPPIQMASLQAANFAFLSLTVFILGFLLSFNSRLLTSTLLAIVCFACAWFVYYIATTGSAMFYARQMNASVESVATYQGFARSALMSLAFLLACSQTIAVRTTVVVCGVIIMFVLGARSEFVGFLLTACLFFTVWSGTNFRYHILALSTVLLVAFLAWSNYEVLSQSRHFQLADISLTTSWIARKGFEGIALAQIADSPVVGLFGGHVVASGSIGSYSHNALSAWVSYGLLGFVLYLTLCSIPAFAAGYQVLIKRDQHPGAILSFCLGFSVLLLVVSAKSVFWIVPAFVWGVYANYLASRHDAKRVHRARELTENTLTSPAGISGLGRP